MNENDMVLKKLSLLKRAAMVVAAFLLLSCSEKNDPSPQPEENNLVSATSVGSWSLTNLKFLIQLSGQDIDPGLFQHNVDIFRVVYKTTYRDDIVEASGLVLLPRNSDAVPIISYQRGTIVKQTDAPSVQERESEQVLSYSALTSMGFITVVPDLIGFGESKDIFHPYYVEAPTASAVTDLMIAASHLAAEKGTGFDGRVFLVGYSQGGYATLATHKSLESDPVEGFDLVASFPGAGGYDLTGMLEYLTGLETYPDPYYLAYVAMAYQSYYDESGLVNSFFREPYASRIPSLFDGVKSSGDIDSQLSQEIATLVREEVLAGSDSYALNEFLREKFEENSLLDWTPVAPIYFYHGDADATVPLSNSQTTYNALLENGADPENVKLTVMAGAGHTSAVQSYIVEVAKKLDELR